MVDFKIGDFTQISGQGVDGQLSQHDIQYFLEGMKNGLFLNQANTAFDISNITKKNPYQGPSFFEVLKLEELRKLGGEDGILTGDEIDGGLNDLIASSIGTTNAQDDFQFSLSMIEDGDVVHFGRKGKAVATGPGKIIASFPSAKVKNFFHKANDTKQLVEKNIGYAKIYSLADEVDYSDYDVLLPPVFDDRNADSISDDINFGEESVVMDGKFVAVSAYYGRRQRQTSGEIPKTAKVFIYKKKSFNRQLNVDPGYEFYSVIEDADFLVEPVLEISGDLLFASDYVSNFVKVYSLNQLGNIENYSAPEPLTTIHGNNLVFPMNDAHYNSEWGRSIKCRDGVNLFVGAPNAIKETEGLAIACGRVDHFVLLEDNLKYESNFVNFAQSIYPSNTTMPWWAIDNDPWKQYTDTISAVFRSYFTRPDEDGNITLTSPGQIITKEYSVQGVEEWIEQRNRELVLNTFSVKSSELEKINAMSNMQDSIIAMSGGVSQTSWLDSADNHVYYRLEDIFPINDYVSEFQVWFPNEDAGHSQLLLDSMNDMFYIVWPNSDFNQYPVLVPTDEWFAKWNLEHLEDEWGSWNEDLNAYVVNIAWKKLVTNPTEGPKGPPGPEDPGAWPPLNDMVYRVVETYFATKMRFGESIDYRGLTAEEEYPNRFSTKKANLVVGAPNYFEDIDKNTKIEELNRTGAVYIFGVSWDYDYNESIKGNHAETQVIIGDDKPEIQGLGVLLPADESEGSFYKPYPGNQMDCDSVSIHFQAETPTQTELINRGSPLYWPLNKVSPFEVSNIEIERDTTNSPHPTPNAKNSIKFGVDGDYGQLLIDYNKHYLLNDSITIEFMWRYDGNPQSESAQIIVGTQHKENSTLNYWNLKWNDSNSRLEFEFVVNGKQILGEETKYDITDGWHHIAIVYGKENSASIGQTELNRQRYVKLYVDGSQTIANPYFSEVDIETFIEDENEQINLAFGSIKLESGNTISGANCFFDDIRITHGIRYSEEFVTNRVKHAFELCYSPTGLGTGVGIDTNYDVYALSNYSGGVIKKYRKSVNNENEWILDETQVLGKLDPVAGGEISIYENDLVYGAVNDLRIFKRTPSIFISDEGDDNTSNSFTRFVLEYDDVSEITFQVDSRKEFAIDWGDSLGYVYYKPTNDETDNITSKWKWNENSESVSYDNSSNTIVENVFNDDLRQNRKIIIEGDIQYLKLTNPSLVSVKVEGSSLESTLGMFSGCTKLKQVDLSNFSAKNIISMERMFADCDSLVELDLSNLNLQTVKILKGMFIRCKNLTTIRLNGWNTENVINMSYMFSRCTNLQQILGINFNTKSVKYFNSMFANCTKLTNINLRGWCTESIADEKPDLFAVNAPFATKESNIPVWGTCTPSVKIAMYFENITELSIPNTGHSGGFEILWGENEPSSVILPTDVDTINYKYSSIVSPVVVMEGSIQPFTFPSNVNSVTIEGVFTGTNSSNEYDRNALVSLKNMFNGCSKLSVTDFSAFNAFNVNSFEGMFEGCTSLTAIDLSGLDTSKVTTFKSLFRHCENLGRIDLKDINTEQLLSISYMFAGCKNLTEIIGYNFDVSLVKFMVYAFANCTKLSDINLSSWCVESVKEYPTGFANNSPFGQTESKLPKWGDECLENSV